MESTAAPMDDTTLRAVLLEEVREHIAQTFAPAVPECTSADALRELGRRAAITSDLQPRLGVRFEPPFPGYGEPPEAMGAHWRMICLARVFAGDRILGTLVTTLVSGRRATVVLTAGESPIPERYAPLIRR